MKKISFKALVESLDAKDKKEKDVAYRFSNGREFERQKPTYKVETE